MKFIYLFVLYICKPVTKASRSKLLLKAPACPRATGRSDPCERQIKLRPPARVTRARVEMLRQGARGQREERETSRATRSKDDSHRGLIILEQGLLH